jgi:hypothetical protein
MARARGPRCCPCSSQPVAVAQECSIERGGRRRCRSSSWLPEEAARHRSPTVCGLNAMIPRGKVVPHTLEHVSVTADVLGARRGEAAAAPRALHNLLAAVKLEPAESGRRVDEARELRVLHRMRQGCAGEQHAC